MIDLPVSVLDSGFPEDGVAAAQSQTDLVALARRAEQLGFLRFWVTEHHGSRIINGAAPPVIIARVAAETASIRVGAGGVMLPNHSPVAVAEQFGTLEALVPGRIDLGIGQGPGSFNAVYIDALRLGTPPLSSEGYSSRIRELLGYLQADETRAVRVALAEEHPPEVWLLSSSPASAGLAAEIGLPLSFAHHINPAATRESLALYRARFSPSRWLDRPRVMLSAGVICGDTDETAAELLRRAGRLRARAVEEQLVPTMPTAQKAQLTTAASRAEESVRNYAWGGPTTVERELTGLVDHFSPDELMLFPALGELKDRIRCIELISDQFPSSHPS